MTSANARIGFWLGWLLLTAACGTLTGTPAAPPSSAGGQSAAQAEKKLPERVSEILMISWAEPAAKSCEADLEGTAKPAHFTLRYSEAGRQPVTVESDPDKLFAERWEIVTRSARGLGFEKRTEFTALDFDIAEELRCKCEAAPGKGDKGGEQNHLINVKLGWKPGAKPEVSARLQKGEAWEEVQPVTINGRLPMWDFRFVRPAPGSGRGECSSRFLVLLGLDQPLE